MSNIKDDSLNSMKNVDIRKVNPDSLVDIHDVIINTDLPKSERILDFIQQIKNPYCFKCGDTVIKITFTETEETIEDKIENYLKSL